MVKSMTLSDAIGSEPVVDGADVVVVKVFGECREIARRDSQPMTHREAVKHIEGKRYWGMYDILCRRSGRYLSFVLFA